MRLLAVEAARAQILEHAKPLAAEPVALGEALGRVLAEPIQAQRDQPPFPASAMDGWAVRAADTPGTLAIVGESAAGRRYPARLAAGQAVRIFTGAPLPAGADAIVIQEEAARDGDWVRVPATPSGQHLRPSGLDFHAGDTLLEAGVRLDPWRLALAAAAGCPSLTVARRPQVAVLATGEEIVAPGGVPGPDQIFDSGSTALSSLIAVSGGAPTPLRSVGDHAAAIAAAVARAGGDVIVTIGGASVGEHDLVKPALASLGLELAVESVAMRPGKPTWFGRLADGRLVLGLPGNPASALVAAELFLRPLLNVLLGADPTVCLATAQSAAPLAANGERESWLRARLSHAPSGYLLASPLADQDSSLVATFAAADALIRRPPRAPAAEVGEPVEVLPLARS